LRLQRALLGDAGHDPAGCRPHDHDGIPDDERRIDDRLRADLLTVDWTW